MSDTSIQSFKQALINIRKDTLKPPPTLSLSQWADANRYLSRESSDSPGRWNTDSSPFQREIMDAMSDPRVERVVGMLGAQLGKTEMTINLAFYYAAQDPAPMLFVMPTVGACSKFSKTKLSPAIRDTPVVKNAFKPVKGMTAGETILEKYFACGSLTLVGAESPVGLASLSVRVLMCDEIDRYTSSAGGEGDPFNLAKKRTQNFLNRKIIAISTPGDINTSRIYQLYLESDQRKFYFKCIHCDEYWEPKWEHVKWDSDTTVEPNIHYPETARLACPNCGGMHTNHERLVAAGKGEWRKHNPTSKIAGFHTTSMSGRWVTLEELVNDWLPAAHKPDLRRAFFNTNMGIPYEELSNNIDDLDFTQRLEPYTPTTMPTGVTYLTAGTDIQGNRIETSVWGWGIEDESWLIEHNVIHGDTTQPETWKLLEDYLKTRFRREDGIYLPIQRAVIDSGHLAEIVTNFTQKNRRFGWFAGKGQSGNRPIFPTLATKSKHGGKLYMLGVDNAKYLIFERLKYPQVGSGYIHFPDSATPEYFQQLAAEKYVQETKKGKTTWTWKQVPADARNEALDCAVYALAAKSSIKGNVSDKRAKQLAQLKKKRDEELENKNKPVQPVVEEKELIDDIEDIKEPVVEVAPVMQKKIPNWQQTLLNKQKGMRRQW